MPAVNPLIDYGQPVAATPAVVQNPSPAASQAGGMMQPVAPDQNTQVNAAGTSENVALHVAALVAFALIGVYVLRQSGFKFVVAGGVGR